MAIESRLRRFSGALGAFAESIESLGHEAFLGRLGGWTPRDIVAHLVGWNRHVIEGSRQIRRGELPFYDQDPGEDYAKVNAALLREYPSRDRARLLAELRASGGELVEFLRSLDAADWDRDFGVRNQGDLVTIGGTVDELTADYDHHREQVERWAARPSAG